MVLYWNPMKVKKKYSEALLPKKMYFISSFVAFSCNIVIENQHVFVTVPVTEHPEVDKIFYPAPASI